MRRMLTNVFALTVIAMGASHLGAQEAEEPDQACCSPAWNDAECCGKSCSAGLLTCKASNE